MKKVTFCVAALILVCLSPDSSWAHGVNLFCYVEGNLVCGEGYFSRGSAVQSGGVEVFDIKSGELLAVTTTNAEGKFCVEAPKTSGIRVVLAAGPGHRGEFLLEDVEETPGTTEQPRGSAVEGPDGGSTTALKGAELERLLDEKLKPLNARISRLEREASEPRWIDIASGIGWIVAIFAMLSVIRKRNAS